MDGETAFDILEWLKIILGFLGPIMVVYVGAKMNQNQKLAETKEAQKQGEQDAKFAKINTALEALEKKIDRVDQELTSVKSTMESMQRLDKGVRSDLAVLARYHEYTVKHLQKISSLTITLSEGMRDNHMDGNISEVVNDVRAFERTMYAELLGNTHLKTADAEAGKIES